MEMVVVVMAWRAKDSRGAREMERMHVMDID